METKKLQELARLQAEQLAKQNPVTLEEAKKQTNRIKKQSEIQFAKDAPKIQEQLKLIQTPLSFSDSCDIYRWLIRKQITIDMISKEVLTEFKNTDHYENFVSVWSKK